MEGREKTGAENYENLLIHENGGGGGGSNCEGENFIALALVPKGGQVLLRPKICNAAVLL